MANDAAWAEGVQIGSERAHEHRAHKQALSDEEHARQVNDLFDQRDSILKNPTMRDTNGQLVSDAQIKLKDIAAQLRESVHPDIHPGALQKFGDLIVRRMNPAKYQQKADSKNASNDASDVKTARGWVSEAPVSPEQQAAIGARSQAVGQKIKDDAREKQLNDWFDRNAVDKSPEARQRFLESAMPGFAARAKLGPLQTYKNSKTGVEFLARDDGYGNLVGPTNELIADEVWQGAVLIGKEGPAKKPTNAEEERESYRLSHNIPSGQPLNFEQEKDFLRQLSLSRNPLGPAHLQIAQAGLTLRQQEDNFKDYVSLQKQLSPLERVIQTSAESDDYVNNPTGPGDVALTLAFFDAIKTSGVRFTQQEQNFIVGSRGMIEGFQAKFDHGYQGTVFGPAGSPQRALVAGIVKKAGDLASSQKAGFVGAAAEFKPQVAGAINNPSSGQQTPGAGASQTQTSTGKPEKATHTIDWIDPQTNIKHTYWLDSEGNNLGEKK